MTITGSCHCGKCGWELDGETGSITACNCTLCRRYGALWAYDYEGERIRLTGKTSFYVREDVDQPQLEIRFCPACANVVAWRGLHTDDNGRRRIAVNVRLAEPDNVAEERIDHFDGLVRFEDLPSDGKCVKDLWF